MADNADDKSERPDNDANPFVDVIPTSPPPLPPPPPSKKKPTQADTSKATTKAEGEGDSKVEAVPAPAAVEPRLLPESPEDRDAYLQREIRNKLKQLKEKQEKVSDLLVQVETLELKIYYVGYITNEAIEEMRDNEASKNSEEPENEGNPVSEVTKKHTEDLTSKSKQAMEGKPQLETLVDEKGEGATGSQDTHKQPMEEGEGPHESSLWKNLPSKPMQEAEGSAPSSPLDSVCVNTPLVAVETVCFSKVVETVWGGDLSSNLSTGDPKVEAVAKPAVVPDPLPAEPEESIVNIKRMLMKEIEVLGQKYERVLQLLENDQGPPEMMKELLEHAINEAKRLRCRDLISYLEKIAKRRSTLAHK